MAKWVERLQRRMGRGKARVAAARKIAELVWRLFDEATKDFDAAKPFGGVKAQPKSATA